MKIILKLLIRYYVNRYANREIVKLTNEEEMDAYSFNSPIDVERLIRANITRQTLAHFDAKSEQERWMVKGASLVLQLMNDKHLYAKEIAFIKDKEKRFAKWKKKF
jgi:hypothetical protein